MQTVLLTGATGFVGRHLLHDLQQHDFNIVLPVRPDWQNRIDINPKQTRVVETNDLFAETSDWWCTTLKHVDMVIHSAWCAEPGSYLTSPKNLDCLSGTMQLAKAAAQTDVKRFVGLGTCIEYEMSDAPLDLDTPLLPTTPYSAAKVAAFIALQEWFTHTDISFLWCRLFHIYGAGEHPNRLFPAIHKALQAGQSIDLTRGAQIRDFIPVETAAEQIIQGTLSQTTGPANICSGTGRSVKEFAQSIADQYNRRDLLNFGARTDNVIDTPKIIGVPTAFA
jgi:nucleoside-diphosphate-sugar epimerase